ncbi:hypothetical protein O3P69_002358 [Scylla paramamosain]|uniref:Uncharacterized protein n=1 Tax=Scylla paramamosain TaxID=85552 RepID=A0AAW0V5Z7_SCYPA
MMVSGLKWLSFRAVYHATPGFVAPYYEQHATPLYVPARKSRHATSFATLHYTTPSPTITTTTTTTLHRITSGPATIVQLVRTRPFRLPSPPPISWRNLTSISAVITACLDHKLENCMRHAGERENSDGNPQQISTSEASRTTLSPLPLTVPAPTISSSSSSKQAGKQLHPDSAIWEGRVQGAGQAKEGKGGRSVDGSEQTQQQMIKRFLETSTTTVISITEAATPSPLVCFSTFVPSTPIFASVRLAFLRGRDRGLAGDGLGRGGRDGGWVVGGRVTAMSRSATHKDSPSAPLLHHRPAPPAVLSYPSAQYRVPA